MDEVSLVLHRSLRMLIISSRLWSITRTLCKRSSRHPLVLPLTIRRALGTKETTGETEIEEIEEIETGDAITEREETGQIEENDEEADHLTANAAATDHAENTTTHISQVETTENESERSDIAAVAEMTEMAAGTGIVTVGLDEVDVMIDATTDEETEIFSTIAEDHVALKVVEETTVR